MDLLHCNHFFSLRTPSRQLSTHLVHLLLLHVHFAIQLSFQSSALSTISTRNTDDLQALLSIKAHLYPSESSSLWDSENQTTHYCKWLGVKCGDPQHPGKVTALDLDSLNLAGLVSPDIGNLTFLQRLSLSGNLLEGYIPQEMGRLSNLQSLILSNNVLEGTIPTSLANCSNLLLLGLNGNKLVGEIPAELGSLPKLSFLLLSKNNLTGVIPPSLGNLSSLSVIALVSNNLWGQIPSSLGRLVRLNHFTVTSNRLTGEIPSSFLNLSSLCRLFVGDNQLSGVLPSSMGNTLPRLQILQAFDNQFQGPIPISLPNASRLEEIVFCFNKLSGPVPRNIGLLRNLSSLSLCNNLLEAKREEDWEFLTSLANCSNLQILDLSDNMLEGLLPNSVAKLSTRLTWLALGGNPIYGSIPADIGQFINLEVLLMDRMLLTGVIPATIGKLQKLEILYLHENQFTGALPSLLGKLTQLTKLRLDQNNLQGGISSTFGNLKKLILLDLSYNKLNGSFPMEFTSLASLTLYLNLSHNSLTGLLPSIVGRLKNLGTLDVSENKLLGEIPNTLSECQVLQYLYMQGNHFQGGIPTSLSSLSGITILDLSRNNLSGLIPESFEGFRNLQLLNLSFNDLDGQVPNEGVFLNASLVSVIGNNKLCGDNHELDLQPCPNLKFKKTHESHKFIVFIATGILISLIIVIFCVYHLWKPRCKTSLPQHLLENNYSKISYFELARATDGFSMSNLISKGNFSYVYRGVVNFEPKEVAIKVLDHNQQGVLKIFEAECNILRSIRHRNLLKTFTICSSFDHNGNIFLAFVSKFMPNGSLDKWLHPRAYGDVESHNLTLLQRLNIASDVASALDYLHHYTNTPIVHCDLKPSNILLDEDMVAHVCDFGLAKFLAIPSCENSSPITSDTDGIKGSIGYIAPEYGMGGKVSTEGDAYSYGMLLLEMFTGRRPTDDAFKNGLNLHSYVQMAYPDHVMEIVDPTLFLHKENEEKAQNFLVTVIKIGLLCSEKLPTRRIKMGDVVKLIHIAKKTFLGDESNKRPKYLD